MEGTSKGIIVGSSHGAQWGNRFGPNSKGRDRSRRCRVRAKHHWQELLQDDRVGVYDPEVDGTPGSAGIKAIGHRTAAEANKKEEEENTLPHSDISFLLDLHRVGRIFDQNDVKPRAKSKSKGK